MIFLEFQKFGLAHYPLGKVFMIQDRMGIQHARLPPIHHTSLTPIHHTRLIQAFGEEHNHPLELLFPAPYGPNPALRGVVWKN